MPLRGETIGTAYIRILADGSGLDDSIRDEFDGVDEEMEARGADHSKSYEKGFNEQTKKNKKIEKSLVKRIDAAFGQMNADAELLGRDFGQRISDEITFGLSEGADHNDKGAREIGDRVAANIVKGFNEGKGLPDLKKSLRGLIATAVKDIQADEAKITASLDDWEKDWRRETDKIVEHAKKLHEGVSREVEGTSRSIEDNFHRIIRQHESLDKGFSDSGEKTTEWRKRLDELDDTIDQYADKSGRAFGRGARNNFINLFGAGVRGFVLLGNVIPKTLKLADEFRTKFAKISEAFTQAGGGLSGFGAAISKAGSEFAPLLANVGLVVGGLVVLVAIVGPLVSIISGLTAAIIALASSLAFALAGALGAVVGLLAPLSAGIGVAVLAITGMNKATKKAISEAVKPLSAELKSLGEVAAESFSKDIPAAVSALTPVLKSFRPLVRGVAAALGDVATGFVASLQSPAFRAATREFTDFLPNAVRQLGSVFTNTFGIVGGLFRSLIPLTSRFLGWLDQITGSFNEWINSTAGQVKMKTFWNDTVSSIKSVGGFLKQATKLLGELFKQGQGAGDTIFDDMAKALGRLTGYLKSNPDSVGEWFSHGVQTARELGGIIESISNLIKSLDTPANRTLGTALLTAVAAQVQAVSLAFQLVGIVVKSVITAIGFFIEQTGNALSLLGKVPKFGWAADIGKDLQGAGKAMQNFGDTSKNLDVDGTASDFDQLSTAINGTQHAFKGSYDEMVRWKLASGGAAANARLLGISQKDLIGATQGNEASIKRINGVLANFKGGTVAQQQALRSLIPALKDLGIQFDSSGRHLSTATALAKGWSGALKGIKDKNVRLAIQQTGFTPTFNAMKKLVVQAGLTPKQLKIAIAANGADLSKKQMNQLITIAKNLGNQKPKPKVTVDPKPAITSLHQVDGAVAHTDKQKANPKVRLDAGGVIETAHAIDRAIAAINPFKQITIQTKRTHVGDPIAAGRIFDKVQANAAGSIHRSNFYTNLLGEQGPEAVVPLSRPLGQVDPSVRLLSAIAQGKVAIGGASKTVSADGWTIVTPTKDPQAVAMEALNRLVALA